MKITSSILFLPVSDIEKTAVFYTEAVGLIKVQEQSGGICRIFDTGYGYLGFCQYPDRRPAVGGDKGPCLSFNCKSREEVDAQYRRVLGLGCQTLCAPHQSEGFPVYSFLLMDPDGYKVEFQVIEEL